MNRAVDKRSRGDRADGALTQERIVELAWAIVDRDGLPALSTRALAAALSVKQPALYWHLRSKEELLGLMVEYLLRHSLDGAPVDLAWPDWLRFVARRQRDAFLARRDSGLIATIAPPNERLRTDLFPRIMTPMLDAGIAHDLASAAAGGIAAFVLGWVLYEQRPETRAFVELFHRPERGFELALDFMIRGLETRATS